MHGIELKNGQVLVHVRVQPKASRNDVMVDEDGRIRVALTAPPVEGAANKALCLFLAQHFEIPRSAVTLVSGDKSREKTVAIPDMHETKIRMLLSPDKMTSK